MAFNVDQFRNHFAKHNDFAKPSKFDVRIGPPTGLKLDTSDLRFQCEATELPGISINTVDARYYGVPTYVASTVAFSDITLTFICAGDFWEKKLFDRWMNLVIPVNDYNANYRSLYTSSKITINQFSEVASKDNTASTIYSVSLFGAFPVALAPMSVNWGDDGVHRLAVTFKYEYWNTADVEQITNSSHTIEKPRPQTDNKVPVASGSSPPYDRGGPSSRRATGKKPDAAVAKIIPPPQIYGGGGGGAGAGSSGSWDLIK